MKEFTFFAVVRVNAKTREEAERMLKAEIDGADANFGAWPNGDPILAEITLETDPSSPDALIEIDGEYVE